MAREKVLGRPCTLMEASMMVSGSTIKSMAMGSTNIWTRQNTMGNGKRISGKATVLITIPMGTVMKETGTMIFSVELAHITTPMGTSTRENGSTGSPTDRETIFTMEIRACIRGIGKTVRRKVLGNWSLMTNTVTQASGKKTKRMAGGPISIRMGNVMRVDG